MKKYSNKYKENIKKKEKNIIKQREKVNIKKIVYHQVHKSKTSSSAR